MTTKLSSAQTILLRRVAAAGDQTFEIAPRARASAAILAGFGLVEGRDDLWRITDAGRAAIGLNPSTPSGSDDQAADAIDAPAGLNPPRAGTKAAQVIEMLGRPEGATVPQLSEVTAWLPHSVRGFLAGALKKKHGIKLESEPADGGRVYRIASQPAAA